ncbi:MAG: leucine--tRNA ligase [Candidatus Micrarchaeota archaeon]|nr:leucine--tRNA ligase [Candidatus Micrarchaeota archaeon]
MDTSENLDFTSVEAKWQAHWKKEKTYEPEIDKKKKKKFVTAAFPYPNSPQHIGHGRTYTTTDVHARYLRLKDYNVIFPMGFHVTGTPIIAMAKRIADGDSELYDVFKRIYEIPDETTKTLTDPTTLVMHFSKEIEEGMKEMGYSIDWRRKFYSFDKHFNKFIEWQFEKLKQLGYLVQGEHPIAWCPADNQAVGGHDTKGDVDPELKDFTAVKFRYGDGFLLTATLRPETIYGVTNIWINPEIMHVKAKSKKTGENYYISKKAAEKMNSQGFELEILEELKGEKMLSDNMKAKNPITGDDLPLYSALYVKDDTGTGIVMSVPSHAPYDHIALLDMGIKLDYAQIIKVDGYKFMAKELVEQRGIKDQHDPKIEDIVKEVYKKEILTGVMIIGPHKGEKVSIAIEKTKNEMIKNKQAFPFWEITNKPVYCRCGAEVVATILKNQWFIDYGNEQWKEKARECIAGMTIVPEKTRQEYLATLEWLRQKACARASGLGTKFPFEKNRMIEALSDSTIYIAFYCFSYLLKNMEEGELNEEFFDYVLLGKGKGNPKWKEAREQFEYWYGEDSYHSGADLVRNHLPFHIFNHVAIFDKKYWPKQFVTNGFVLMDGKKMSKSMGNILPLRKAIKEYGADVIRFSVVSGADLTQDTDFNKSVAEGTKSRLEFIAKLVTEISNAKDKKKDSRIDKWLLSRMNRKIKNAEELYEKIALRELSLEIFYDVYNDLQWYLKRSGNESYGETIKEFLKVWSVLIQPFMPHLAEEFWNLLGEKKTISKFPEYNDKKINEKIERGEELVKQTLDDALNIAKLLGKKPEKIYIYVASEWKRKLYNIVKNEKAFDKVMKTTSQDSELRTHMQDVQRITKQLMKNAYSLQEIENEKDELATLKDAEEFLTKELDCPVNVASDSGAKHERAKNALPGKPAIVLE